MYNRGVIGKNCGSTGQTGRAVRQHDFDGSAVVMARPHDLLTMGENPLLTQKGTAGCLGTAAAAACTTALPCLALDLLLP